MKRFLLIFLLIMLPLQMSWAAVSDYCEHETGKAAQHLGHHEHKHQASGEKKVAKSKFGASDADCSFCHHAGTIIISSLHPAPAMPGESALPEFSIHRYLSPVPEGPSRPNWRLAI